jgi:MtN3 and saliva related transmembrane protein
MPLTDPHVGTTMNVFLIIGNVINLIQNIPQVIKTYNTKSTKDFSAIFLSLRIVGNVIWIAYAVEINSLLLIINNSVTVLSTVFISFYKVRELLAERRCRDDSGGDYSLLNV